MIQLIFQRISSIKSLLFILFTLSFILFSCSEGGGNNGGGGGSSNATLTSISLYSANSLIHLNTTQQVTATGIYSNGTTKNITNLVTWSSSNSSSLSVSNSTNTQGIVSALTAGSNIVITASLNGVSASTSISVSSASLQSIVITNPVLIAHVGVNVQLTATGIYSDGSQNITNYVIWGSSATSFATITTGNNSGGLVSPLAAGTTAITASQPLST
ncbi:MAG TPA: Ig-like domain-containing protein, partial [Burkholderiales bacterium]|nr:Ig-like domain-containing protein [Burkholderiales bacterium]